MQCRIAEYRKALGMSQETLSEKSGVSRAIISGLEHGTERTTMVSTLSKIADALNVGVKDLFYDQDV